MLEKSDWKYKEGVWKYELEIEEMKKDSEEWKKQFQELKYKAFGNKLHKVSVTMLF